MGTELMRVALDLQNFVSCRLRASFREALNLNGVKNRQRFDGFNMNIPLSTKSTRDRRQLERAQVDLKLLCDVHEVL